jgi:hypothetical protein
MKRYLHGLAALPLFAGVAMAHEPMTLTSQQLDKVTAGFKEVDASNTSLTVLTIWQRAYLTNDTGNFVSCSTCYLVISTPTISIASHFGPTAVIGSAD